MKDDMLSHTFAMFFRQMKKKSFLFSDIRFDSNWRGQHNVGYPAVTDILKERKGLKMGKSNDVR